MKTRLLSLLFGILLALPPAAHADTITFGSDLSGTPTIDQGQQADVLFFNEQQGGNGHASPVSGQVLEVRIKGTALKSGPKDPNTLFHTQVLRPLGGDKFHVESSSQGFHFPFDIPADTVSRYVPSVQCIDQGQVFDFNEVGGWDGTRNYQEGVRYKIFARKPGSQVFWYSANERTNVGQTVGPNGLLIDRGNGYQFEPQPKLADTELMMQVVVGTGYDADPACTGGRKGLEYKGVEITTPKPTPKVYDNGIARARVTCRPGSAKSCEGSLRLEAEGQQLGTSAPFRLGVTEATNVSVQLTNAGAALLGARGTLKTTATADTRDAFGVAKTDTGTVTLTSSRGATGGGFVGLTARAQSLTYKPGGTLGLKVTCPAGTPGSCIGTASISSQKRIKGKVYKMATGRFTVAAGTTASFPVKLTRTGLNVLKKRKTIVSIATLKAKDGSGRTASNRVKVTFKYRAK